MNLKFSVLLVALFLCLLSSYSCKPSQQAVISKQATVLSEEEKAYNAILALPEVKERAAYIEKQTNGERHMKLWTTDKPSGHHNYYTINVGEDNGSALVTHFQFYYYPTSKKILYYDTANDKPLTLEEWRKKAKE